MKSRLIFHGHFYQLLFFFIFLSAAFSIGGSLLDVFIKSFTSLFSYALFAFVFENIYAFVFLPAFSYLLLSWFLKHTEVFLSPDTKGGEAALPLQGHLFISGHFFNFVYSSSLALCILVFTLGIAWPYYIYAQIAWFFKNSQVRFSSGQLAQLSLHDNFIKYFFKSWTLMLLPVLSFILIMVFNFFIGFSGLSLSITSLAFLVLGASSIFLVIYYIYWVLKWYFIHAELTFKTAAHVSESSQALPPVVYQFLFIGGYLNFVYRTLLYAGLAFFSVLLVSSALGMVPTIVENSIIAPVLNFILAIFTTGLIGSVYLYWLGPWAIRHVRLVPVPIPIAPMDTEEPTLSVRQS